MKFPNGGFRLDVVSTRPWPAADAAGCSHRLQSPYSLASRVLFILQAGYFKAKTLFFSFEIDEVAGRVCLTIENFNAASWYRG